MAPSRNIISSLLLLLALSVSCAAQTTSFEDGAGGQQLSFRPAMRCGHFVVLHELQPHSVGGIRLRGATLFRINGPGFHEARILFHHTGQSETEDEPVSIGPNFVGSSADSEEPTAGVASVSSSDATVASSDLPAVPTLGEIQDLQSDPSDVSEQSPSNAASSSNGAEAEESEEEDDPTAAALHSWVDRDQPFVRLHILSSPFLPLFRTRLFDFDNFWEIRARALRNMMLVQSLASQAADEERPELSTESESESDRLSEEFNSLAGDGTRGEGQAGQPVEVADQPGEDEEMRLVNLDDVEADRGMLLDNMVDKEEGMDRIVQSARADNQPEDFIANMMKGAWTSPYFHVGLLLGLFVLICTYFAICSCQPEEGSVIVVVNAPDTRTPLLQTYDVQYTEREQKAVGEPVGAEKGVVAYVPPLDSGLKA